MLKKVKNRNMKVIQDMAVFNVNPNDNPINCYIKRLLDLNTFVSCLHGAAALRNEGIENAVEFCFIAGLQFSGIADTVQ